MLHQGQSIPPYKMSLKPAVAHNSEKSSTTCDARSGDMDEDCLAPPRVDPASRRPVLVLTTCESTQRPKKSKLR